MGRLIDKLKHFREVRRQKMRQWLIGIILSFLEEAIEDYLTPEQVAQVFKDVSKYFRELAKRTDNSLDDQVVEILIAAMGKLLKVKV